MNRRTAVPHGQGTQARACVPAVVLPLLLASSAFSQELKPIGGIVVDLSPGPSVQTDLGYDIVINRHSSLNRIAAVVNGQRSPLRILPGSTVKTAYIRERSSGDYRFVADARVEAAELVAAFEIRFLLLDVLGDRMKSLSGMFVRDIQPGVPLPVDGQGMDTPRSVSARWRASERDIAELGTTIVWIAKVRRADGSIWEIDENELLEELAKVRKGITREDLESDEDDR